MDYLLWYDGHEICVYVLLEEAEGSDPVRLFV